MAGADTCGQRGGSTGCSEELFRGPGWLHGLTFLVACFQFGSAWLGAAASLPGAPMVMSLPDNARFRVGQDASLTVVASGTPPFSYQWRHGEEDLAGATGPTCALGKARSRQAGSYSVVVRNSLGSVTSGAVNLIVDPALPLGVVSGGQIEGGNPTALTGLTSIASGGQRNLALKEDWTVVAWGQDPFGAALVPPGLNQVAAVAAGRFHSAALRGDGTVVAWGRDSEGQTDVPVGLNGLAAIAAGGFHTLALKEDGTVVAWGDNSFGQSDVPPGLNGVAAVAAGRNYSLALRRDGTVLAWGDNGHGQTNVPSDLPPVIAIAAGSAVALVLKQDGTLAGWGDNAYGQADVPADLHGITAIAAGGFFGIALAGDGVARAWGELTFGQGAVMHLNGLRAIAAGEFHFAALTIAPVITTQPVGRPVAAGQTVSLSVVATGVEPLRYQWRKDGLELEGATNATLTLSGVQPEQAGTYTVTVSSTADGVVGSVGSEAALLTVVTAPVILSEPSSQAVDLGGEAHLSVVALGVEPLSYQWRKDGSELVAATGPSFSLRNVGPADAGQYTVVISNAFGSLTSSVATLEVLLPPVLLAQPADQIVPAGQTASLTVSVQGTAPLFYRWFKDGVELADVTGATLSFGRAKAAQSGGYAIIVSNAAGSVTSAVARVQVNPVSAGRVVAWGGDGSGQTEVPDGLHDVISIAAGSVHNLALREQGTVVAWGENSDRQSNVPAGLDRVTDIAAGVAHSVALRDDAAVVSWGDPEAAFNLGGALPRAVAIAGGRFQTLILRRDGTVVAQGDSVFGEASVPAGLSGVIAVSAGRFHSLALRDDGTVVAWGNNMSGQTDVPDGLTSVRAVAGGGAHSLALTRGGIVVAWGENSDGQTNVPPGLAGVVAIAAGQSHSVALKADGTVVAWGKNSDGQAAVPPDLRGVVAISAGTAHTVALVVDAPVITAQPVSQTLSVGQALNFAVAATNHGPLRYQWRKGGLDIPGATNAFYYLPEVQLADAGVFSVVVMGLTWSAASLEAILTVVEDPVILSQPAAQQVLPGASATLSVIASGARPLVYQWYFNGAPIPGANAPSLALDRFGTEQSGAYAVMVINGVGSVLSDDAVLTLASPPTIVSQPRDAAGAPGSEVVFTVEVTGTSPFQYQWVHDGDAIEGATEPAYTVAVALERAGDYWVEISNAWGAATSAVARLSIVVRPEILEQPVSQRLAAGALAHFAVRATGTEPLSYQWRANGVAIAGATGASLSLSGITTNEAGRYSVVVANAAGEAISDDAVLTVIAPFRLTLGLLSGYPLLMLSGALGQQYVIQYGEGLAGSDWVTLVVFSNLSSSPRTFIDTTPATNLGRWYRVRSD